MREKKGKILKVVLLLAIICIIAIPIIGIQIANKNAQQIADIESKSEEILATEKVANPSWTYNATGGVQTFTVPTTGTYTFSVTGAAGADGSWNGEVVRGGYGARITGKVKLTQGTVLYLNVGKKGVGATGGWNGGGNGAGAVSVNRVIYEEQTYIDDNPSRGFSGGGGGASDIRLGGNALGNRILVAPGGAGAGCSMYCLTHVSDNFITSTGGHTNTYIDSSHSNGNASGRGSDYVLFDNNYWEDMNDVWMHRVTYSGGGGGGYYGGETLLYTGNGEYVKEIKSPSATNLAGRAQDSFGFAGTSYYDQNLVSDVTYLTRNSSIYSDVNVADGSNGLEGSITITLDHAHTYRVVEVKGTTCTEQGRVVSRCTICNDEVIELVPALGHDTTGDYVYETNNNIPKGLRYKNCKRCGIRLETAYLLSLIKGNGIQAVTGGGYYAKGTRGNSRSNSNFRM